VSTKTGYCKPISGPLAGLCMRTLVYGAGLDAQGLPNAMHPYFANSSVQSGCQFCNISNQRFLVSAPNGVACPSQLCKEATPNAQNTVCDQGQCIGSTQCKECHECRNSSIGCQLVQNHCLVGNVTCGCMIDGVCYMPEAREPGNICRKASLNSANVRSRCTGRWENMPDSVVNCKGATACEKLQQCRAGTCLSEPYAVPEPCHKIYTCRGNENAYNYTLLTNISIITDYTQNDVKKYFCNQTYTHPCSLPKVCRKSTAVCPSGDNFASLIIGSNGQLTLKSGELFVAPPLSIAVSPPRVWFQDELGQNLTTCTVCKAGKLWNISAGKCMNGTGGASCIADRFSLQTLELEAAANVCGGIEYRYYLQNSTSTDTSCPITEPQRGLNGIFWMSGNLLSDLAAAGSSQNQLPADGQRIRAIVTMKPQVLFPKGTAPFVRLCSPISTFDSSPPLIGGIKLAAGQYVLGTSSLPPQLGYVNTADSLTILFTKDVGSSGWSDPHSGIQSVHVGLYRTKDNNLLFAQIYTEEQVFKYSNATFRFLQQVDGTNVTIEIMVFNRANLSSLLRTSVVLDASAPLFLGMTITDCMSGNMSVDSDYWAHTGSLSACLGAGTFSDSVSGILQIESVLQLQSGNIWVDVNQKCTHPNNTQKITYNHIKDACKPSMMPLPCNQSSVCLTPKSRYRFQAWAVNRAGASSLFQYTNGILLDNTGPVPGQVYHRHMSTGSFDGRILSSGAIGWQSSSSKLSVTWDPFTDGESSLLFYAWEIGLKGSDGTFSATVSGLESVGWAYANGSMGLYISNATYGSKFELAKSGLALQHNMTYFVRISCRNQAGLNVTVISAGVKIDLTPPNMSRTFVNDVTKGDERVDADVMVRPDMLCVFAGGFFDCESSQSDPTCQNGLETLEYAFGHSFDAYGSLRDEIMAWTRVGETRLLCTTLNETKAAKYYASVRVCNRAGLCANATSDGLSVDFDPPFGYVQDGNKSADISWQAEDDILCASWSNITDPQSGVKVFEVAYGLCNSSFEMRAAFLDIGLNTSFCFTSSMLKNLPLQRLMRYCVAVRSTNNFRLVSVIISDGVQISMPPSIGHVFDGLGGQDVDFSRSPQVAISWKGFERNGAPVHHFYAGLYREDTKKLVYKICTYTQLSSCSANLTEALLSTGIRVFAQVCAVNTVLQVACNRSNGFIPDYDGPIPGRVVNGKQLAKHINVQSDTDIISAMWSGFLDTQSGIHSCTWSVGTSYDKEAIFMKRNIGRAAWAKASGLSLWHGLVFYIRVVCTNMAGLTSESLSESVLVHTEPPRISCLSILPKLTNQEDIWYTSDSRQVYIKWCVDDISRPLNVSSRIAIGTVFGGQEILPFGTNLSSPWRLPQFADGLYYISLLLMDSLDRTAFNGRYQILVDSLPPTKGKVSLDNAQSCIGKHKSLNVTWDGFYDFQSRIFKYEVAIGNAEGDETVYPFRSVDLAQYLLIQASFGPGRYVVTVRAWNRANLSSVASLQIVVDSSPPILAGIVVSHPVNGLFLDKLACQAVQSPDKLVFSWAFSDSECAVTKYEYAVVKFLSSVGNTEYQDVSLQTSVAISPSFDIGEQYEVVVRATNAAGLFSVHRSKPVLVTSPSINFTVQHASPSTMDVHSGVVLVSNTSGILKSLACSAGFAPYMQQVSETDQKEGNYPLMASNQVYSLNVSCAPPSKTGQLFQASQVYLTVRVKFCTGYTQVLSSKGKLLDVTPPIAGRIEISESNITRSRMPTKRALQCAALNKSLEVEWQDFMDHESGISRYEVGISTEGTNVIVLSYIPVNLSQIAVLNTSFGSGRFVVNVRAWNKANMWAVASRSFLVDSTPPVASDVAISHPLYGVLQSLPSCQAESSSIPLVFSWAPFADDECNVVQYEYAVQTLPASSNSTQPFVGLGLNRTVTIASSLGLSKGKQYRVLVRATNAASLQTTISSMPVLIASKLLQCSLLHSKQGFISSMSNLSGILTVYGTGQIQSIVCSASMLAKGQKVWGAHVQKGVFPLMVNDTEVKLQTLCSSHDQARAVNGLPVYLSAKLIFCTGQVSVITSPPAILDMTPPNTDGIHFVDDNKQVLDFLSNISNIKLKWKFADKQSGIMKCELNVSAVSKRGKNIGIFSAQCAHSANSFSLNTTASISNASFVVASLRCCNNAYLCKAVTKQIVIDTTPPVSRTGIVVHIDPHSQQNASCQQDLNMLSFYWSDFSDQDSGIRGYEYRILDVQHGGEICSWRNVGLHTKILAQDIQLMPNSTYVVEVKACNNAGLSSIARSTGLRARPVPPKIVSVRTLRGELQQVTSQENDLLKVRLSVQGFTSHVACCIGTSPERCEASSSHTKSGENANTQEESFDVTCEFIEFSPRGGSRYYTTIKAYACGMLGKPTTVSYHTLLDVSPPLPGSLYIMSKGKPWSLLPSQRAREEDAVTFVSLNSTLELSWEGFWDIETEITSYTLSVSECLMFNKMSSCTMREQHWAVLPTASYNYEVAIASKGLLPNKTYALQLEAKNAANLTVKTMVYMNVDNSPPLAGRVLNVENVKYRIESACLSNNRMISAVWEGFSDDESSIVLYEWSAGRTKSNCDLVPWTSVEPHITHASAAVADKDFDTVFITVKVQMHILNVAFA
jgi:hypothetical protein